MRSTNWRARVFALGAVIAMLAGCAQATSGEPVAAESRVTSTLAASLESGEVFDPCDIPKSVVSESGLAVETERTDLAGISSYPGWQGCTWDGAGNGAWYYLAVMASLNSMDEYLQSPQNTQEVPVTIGERSAVQYHDSFDKNPPEGCDIVLQAGENMVIFSLYTVGSEETLGDPCSAVGKHTRDLAPYLPN